MKKIYAIVVFALMALSVSAQSTNISNKKVVIPDEVRAFLNTSVGKRFDAQQVMSVYGKHQDVLKSASVSARDTVLNESFKGLTKGSEENPDTANIGNWDQEVLDATLDYPGWLPYRVGQAGGCAYEGINPEDTNDPGYLMTPDINTTDGVYVFSAKVKNINPNATNYGMQYFVMDNGCNQMIIAASCSLKYNEWTDVSFEIGQRVDSTAVMFFSWRGMLLIDDVVIEKVTYSLDSPENVTCKLNDINNVSLSWDAVNRATRYRVDLKTSDKILLKSVTTDATSLNTEVEFDPMDGLYVFVTALNETEESHYTSAYFGDLSPASIDAPVAKDATNVTENGLTANWEKVPMAYTYEVHGTYSHTAAKDGEEYYYMDDDFSEVTTSIDDTESTVMTQDGSLVLLDDYISTPGWSVYIASVSTGMLAITNAISVVPGILIGPKDNYSLGNGKVTVSGIGMSSVDDVIVTVGFARKTAVGVQFINGTTKTIEMAPNDPEPFEVTLEGGADGNRIMFKITDASSEGDMACFKSLQIKTALNAGESYTQTRPTITVPYTETSCNVELPFANGDKYSYVVNGAFDTVKSADSNTITVEYNASGIKAVSADADAADAKYYTLDGRMISKNAAQHGLYVVRSGNNAKVVMK